MKPLVQVFSSTLACLALWGIASASHVEPKVAKKFVTPLVTAYAPCLAPDADYLGFPACLSLGALDGDCQFTATGYGSAKATVITSSVHDVRLVAKLIGLSPSCEGRTLKGVVKVRVTLDACGGSGSAPCTVVDLPLEVGECVVTKGSCRVDGTINTAHPGVLLTGRQTGIEIVACSIDDALAAATAFSCGLLVQ